MAGSPRHSWQIVRKTSLTVLMAGMLLGSLVALCAPLLAQSSAQQPLSAQVQSTAQSPSQSRLRAVRLSDAEGTVQIMRGNQPEFDQAYQNMPLLEGSRLQTGTDGRAEIQFEDGAVARLTPNSSLNLTQLGRSSSGAIVNQLEALSGLMYFEIGADHNQQYSIQIGPDTVSPNETTVLRLNLDTHPTEVVVLQGSATLANSAQPGINVHEGETIRIGDGLPYDLTATITPDSWDQWNLDRDQALAAIGSQQTTGLEAGGEAPNQSGGQGGAGWSDLDYYGDWYNVPGYGDMWAPNNVDADWDPYGSGYWADYPGYGDMWISANPWGWLPYRCGAWNYFNSFGWGWLPTNCSSGWFPGVPIWNAPWKYVRPRRPIRPIRPIQPVNRTTQHWPIIAVNRSATPTSGRLSATPRGSLTASSSARSFEIPGGRAGGLFEPLPKTTVPERALLAGTGRSISGRDVYATIDNEAATTRPQYDFRGLASQSYRAPYYNPNSGVRSGPGTYSPGNYSPGHYGRANTPAILGPRYEPRSTAPPSAPRASPPATSPAPRSAPPAGPRR